MDDTKRCKDCGETKNKSQFYVNKIVTLKTGEVSTYLNPYCIPCHKTRAYTGKRRTADEALMRIWGRFELHPCQVCGETNPIKLSFDHRDGSQKVSPISSMMGRPWPDVEAELSKCDVLCHNCHAVKTAAQLNWFRAAELRDYVESWPENRAAYKRYAA